MGLVLSTMHTQELTLTEHLLMLGRGFSVEILSHEFFILPIMQVLKFSPFTQEAQRGKAIWSRSNLLNLEPTAAACSELSATPRGQLPASGELTQPLTVT